MATVSSRVRTAWVWDSTFSLPTAEALSQGPSAAECPRITIITPSFNQGQYIEETIRSVLGQGYPNLEYIIIDGGSKDETVSIIKRYEQYISYWVSEPDKGQTDALNKGLARATGEIIAYLNSDDVYLPGALWAVAEAYGRNPDADLFHGTCVSVDNDGREIGRQTARISEFSEIVDLWKVWWGKRQFVQPEVFWTSRISEKIGEFRTSLFYVMDYEYWLRILRAGGKVCPLHTETSCFRFTPNQKSTAAAKAAQELLDVVKPVLWDWSSPLSLGRRLRLQGEWLYQTRFLKAVEDSIIRHEPFWQRYYRLGVVCLTNPQVFASESLKYRIANPARSLAKKLHLAPRPKTAAAVASVEV